MNKKTYQEAYDSLTYTDRQKACIAARAAQAAGQTPRHSRRILSKAAIAACLIFALTLSAEAAGISTPVSDILAPIFGGSVAQTEVIDKIGQPIDASDTHNGITIRADAIIGDAYNACLIFSIIRDDGTPLLPEDIPAQRLSVGGFCDLYMGGMGGSHGSARFLDSNPGDNVVQYLYTISSDSPLNKGTAKVEFDNLSYWDDATGERVPLIEGRWKFRFDVDYEDSSVRLGSGETFTQHGMNFTITDIRVSPVGIRVEYEVDSEVQWSNAPSGRLPEEDRMQMERYLENVEILLVKKDGTVIDLSNSGGSVKPENGKTYCTKSNVLEQLLPLEELDSIRVGSISYPIPSE